MLLAAAAIFFLAVGIALGSIIASRKLHEGLLENILHCAMAFFDTTPIGRIVNRFSKDVDILDASLPMYMQNWLMTFAPVISTIIVIIYTTPVFVAVVVPLAILFVILQVSFICCFKHLFLMLLSPSLFYLLFYR